MRRKEVAGLALAVSLLARCVSTCPGQMVEGPEAAAIIYMARIVRSDAGLPNAPVFLTGPARPSAALLLRLRGWNIQPMSNAIIKYDYPGSPQTVPYDRVTHQQGLYVGIIGVESCRPGEVKIEVVYGVSETMLDIVREGDHWRIVDERLISIIVV